MKPTLRHALIAALLGVLGLAAVLATEAARNSSRQIRVTAQPAMPVDIEGASRRLAAAVQIPTISYDDSSRNDPARFTQLRELLARSYPNAHRRMRLEVINGSSLLFSWRGTDPSLRPVLLLAHQDVVPISPGTQDQWRQDPFGGAIADGFVWGRGAWDDKGNLLAIMEAVEALCAQGREPRRSVLLAFGHDEEIGGGQGAGALAAALRARGVHAQFALDEGLLVTQGILQGLEMPVALIGIAEKGYATVTLTARAPGGHASMPPDQSAIGNLSRALVRLDEQPVPTRTPPAVRQMFETLAPEFGGFNRLLLSNLWLFEPLVRHQIEGEAAGRAMLRTTAAFTMFQAGDKDNVLPGMAQAKVNFRLLPGDTTQGIVDRVRQVIADLPVQAVLSDEAWDPTPLSHVDAQGYRDISRAVRETFPGAIVAPGLLIAATDSRHYAEVADEIYRFTPVRAGPQDLARFHGANERISLANYAEMIRFYHRLLELCAMAPANPPG